jgi:hypothetical protein
MTLERLLQPEDAGQPTQPGGSARLAELRRRADQYAQAARDAIERVKALGETQRQLESLRNVSAQ